MISRRIIRIKVLQTLYSYRQIEHENYSLAQNELFFSINKSYDLYYLLLNLSRELVDYAKRKIESNRNKFLTSQEDINPNLKFVENKVIAQLRDNTDLNTRVEKNSINFEAHPELIVNIYKQLIQDPKFIEYQNDSDNSYEKDKEFLMYFYEEFLINCPLFFPTLESMSIYWIDTVEFILSMILRTLEKINESDNSSFSLMPMYKNEDDQQFAVKLLKSVINNKEENQQLIKACTKNWDLDRIALMDMLILEIAVSEIKEFLEIPLRVTFNEYIEISKFFSTAKSSQFINGVLDKIVEKLIAEKQIKKIVEKAKEQ